MSLYSWRDRAIEQAQSVDRGRLRSLRTVERIVSAARALVIAGRGEPFTLQNVVERSSCSLQTIYRYFPSKDDLLLAVFEETIAAGTEMIRAAAASHRDPVERLRAIVAASIPEIPPDGFDMDATVLVSVHTRLALLFPTEVERAQQPYVELVRETLQQMLDAGRIPPRVSLDEDARLITYLARATFQAMITSRSGEPRARVAEHAAEFCLAALEVRGASHRGPGRSGEVRQL